VTLDVITKFIFGHDVDFDLFGEDQMNFIETYKIYSQEVKNNKK
jgi:hypothetical protein